MNPCDNLVCSERIPGSPSLVYAAIPNDMEHDCSEVEKEAGTTRLQRISDSPRPPPLPASITLLQPRLHFYKPGSDMFSKSVTLKLSLWVIFLKSEVKTHLQLLLNLIKRPYLY